MEHLRCCRQECRRPALNARRLQSMLELEPLACPAFSPEGLLLLFCSIVDCLVKPRVPRGPSWALCSLPGFLTPREPMFGCCGLQDWRAPGLSVLAA